MFSDKIKTVLTFVALAGAALALPGAANAGVVVKSTGPSAGDYPVGRQVADNATITLQAGDKITVLTDSGTSVLQGPGDFEVGAGATRTRTRFSSLSRRSVSRPRTGAVRGGPSEGEGAVEPDQAPPSLWMVNLAEQGAVCLLDLNRVNLWRPDPATPQTYTIEDQTTQATLDVTFVGTEAMRAWDPAALPVVAGRSYAITGPMPAPIAGADPDDAGASPAMSPTTKTFSFAALSGTYRKQDELAQDLIANGCGSQLSQLADELEAYVEAKEG
jgi:hypothetical protein